MSSYEEAKAYKEQIGEKLKGRKWFLGVGITKAPNSQDWAIKLNVRRYPFFCRIPGDGKIEIIWEKTSPARAL